MAHKNDGCAGDEMVTVVDVYSRRLDGGIEHHRLLSGSWGCAECTATHDSPAECGCERCLEGCHA